MKHKTFLSYEINNISDTAILRSRPESDIGLGLSKHLVQMKDWPRTDVFGEVEMLGDSKSQTYTAYDAQYERILQVLLDLGLSRRDDEENESSDEQPDLEVWFYKNHKMILIHVPDLYVLPEANTKTMRRPFEAFEIINQTNFAILRVRPQDRIDDGLSEFIVQMRGWPYTWIFGTVAMPGLFKRTFYESTSPFFKEIQTVLKDLGLEQTGRQYNEPIEVRRYKEDMMITIIVPNTYSYTIPKREDDMSKELLKTEELRFKKDMVALSHFGNYAKLFDLTTTNVSNGKVRKYFRVNIDHSDLTNAIDKQAMQDEDHEKLYYLYNGSLAYDRLVDLLKTLGVSRKSLRRDKYALVKRNGGYIMELSQTAFEYKETEYSVTQRDKRENGIASGNTNTNKGNVKPKGLREIDAMQRPTVDLLNSTFTKMVERLRSFEKSNPQESTSWLRDNWESVCIERIQEALRRGRIYDAMNYLMFAQHHGWDTSKVLVAPECRTVSTEDIDARTIPYTFATYKDYCDYNGLYSVLIDALDQAAYGKGMERHANNLPFEEQKMQTICDAQGSSKGMAYQAIKKILESEGMGYQAKKREILGAIVYAAGIIIWEEKQPIEE